MRFFAAAALALTPLSAGASEAVPFDALVVFGDSLSDTGNAGRFSNGPVWVEGLAESLGLSARPSQAGGLNYAIGGARLDPASGPTSLPAQLQRHLAGEPDPGELLYVVYGGGNDLIAAALGPAGDSAVDRAVASVRGMLFELAERGAGDILVPNLPDVGMTPAARGGDRTQLDRATRLTDRFNAALEASLLELEATYDLQVYRLDVRAMAERARRDPAAFGFADVTTPCISLPSCAGHLFWDDIHPTAAAHARLAEAALLILKER